jgi:plastocyanin
MRRTWVMGVAGVLAVAGLTSCGDDGEDTAVATDAPAVSLPGTVSDHGSAALAAGGALDLELDDQYFAPTFVDAPAGATVQVTLTNEGDLPHTFTIDGTDIDEQVDAGGSATVEVTLPDSGSLRFYCRFHVGGGMQGAFVVSDAASSSGTTVAPVVGGGGGY